jgi:plastocyanin
MATLATLARNGRGAGSRLVAVAVALGALTWLGALAACGGAAGSAGAAGPVVGVVGYDTMRYAPETVTVKAGEAVTISFTNRGILPHDLITQGAETNASLVNVTAGREQRGTFRADKPGEYAFVCIQPGHKEAGMIGKIVVDG